MTKKTPPDFMAGFYPMACDDFPVRVLDRWQKGRLRKTAMTAYDRLARQGEILPDGVFRCGDGAIAVKYRARIPDAWVHDLLAKAEREQENEKPGTEDGKPEQMAIL